jgi:DNA-binding Lrp family transcriptional regulator
MITGFILISTVPTKEHEVYNELLKVKEIIELHPLFGEYDIMAKVEAKDPDELAQIIINKIRKIEGVTDTKTLTGVRF